MNISWTSVGAMLMAAAVALGAFGAHGLRERLDPYLMGVYEKAVLYHFIHALGLLAVVVLCGLNKLPQQSEFKLCLMFLLGILIFSGSLYLYAITGIRWLGAITPIGGVLFIVGWILTAWYALRQP